MSKEKKQEIMPSVLAFEKKLVPSDGYFYGAMWEDRENKSKRQPLKIIEKSVRGTISNRFNSKDKNEFAKDPTKLDTKVEYANLQIVDNCSLNEDQDTLITHFTLKILSGLQTPWVSNSQEFNKTFAEIIKKYQEKFGYQELAKRYAINLANAGFLWRNRVGAENIEVNISIIAPKNSANKSFKFDAKKISQDPLKDFSNQVLEQNSDLKNLASEIADALAGINNYQDSPMLLDVVTYAKIGVAQDVYPSQELVLNKNNSGKKNGDKSKILYRAILENNLEIGAMHSQKIGNAIRTIDSWYPEILENHNNPIAVEPYGSVTTLGKAFRKPKENTDFYSIFDKLIEGKVTFEAMKDNDLHYIIATLIRGGIFGKSENDKNDKSKESDNNDDSNE